MAVQCSLSLDEVIYNEKTHFSRTSRTKKLTKLMENTNTPII
jgi:hypothetical protein